MSQPQRPRKVAWVDLTVADADRIRDFYSAVIGWQSRPLDMGGYHDYNMLPPEGGNPVAGICHARGENADIPPQWLPYFTVENVERAAQSCLTAGGEVLLGPKGMVGARYCVIRDPAGAVCALYQPPASGGS